MLSAVGWNMDDRFDPSIAGGIPYETDPFPCLPSVKTPPLLSPLLGLPNRNRGAAHPSPVRCLQHCRADPDANCARSGFGRSECLLATLRDMIQEHSLICNWEFQ